MSQVTAGNTMVHPGQRTYVAQVGLAVLVGVGLGLAAISPSWTQAVALVGLTSIAVLQIIHPAYGLLLWMFLAPYAQFIHLKVDLGSGIPDLDLTRLSVVVLFGQFLHYAYGQRTIAPEHRQSVIPPAIAAAMLAFVTGMVLSVPASSMGLVAGVQTVFDFVLTPFLVLLFARAWLGSPGMVQKTIGVIALIVLVLGTITVREQLTGATVFSPVSYELAYEGDIRKVLSLFRSPVTMGTILAIPVPILIYGIRRTRSAALWTVLGLALAATLAGTFFTYVRASWLGAVLGMVIVLLLSPGLRRAVLPIIIILAIAGAVWAGDVINTQTVQERFESEQSIDYRIRAWGIAWELFRQSPVLGIGYDNYGRAAAEQFGWNPHTQTMVRDLPAVHNTYLYVATSGGLLAIVPYVAVFVAVFLEALRFWRRAQNRDLVAALCATLLGYMAMIGTFDALNAQFANMVFFLVIGTLLGRLEHLDGAPA